MKVKLYRSATVGIIFKNFKILCDPWLTDGEYYGSWYHFPQFKFDQNVIREINSYDAIYISHIHPDHCSEKTLEKINKNIPIYIHSYHAKFLKFKLSNYGFKVIEIENNKKFFINNDIFINIIAADNCDPTLCYKFTGCAEKSITKGSQQIDSYAFIGNNKYTLLNINDCPFELAKFSLKKNLKNFNKIDLLLTGYGGAGPYPQCFNNLKKNEKRKEASLKKEKFLKMATDYIDLAQPRYYLPFAGKYVLGGKLAKLNNLRGVPDLTEAYKFLEKYYIKKNCKNIKSLKLNPGSHFDFSNKTFSSEYKPIDKKKYESFVKSISKKSMNYEKDPLPNLEQIKKLSDIAFLKCIEKNKKLKNIFDTKIFINFKIGILKLSFSDEKMSFEKKNFFHNNKGKNFVEYKVDPRLFYRLLKGPKYAHWNNAEIGSHIQYIRKPNVFNRRVYQSVCYFHN